MLETIGVLAGILGGVAIIVKFIHWFVTRQRIEFVDCYDAGLFATPILWFASERKSPHYKTAAKQLHTSLKRLRLPTSIINSLTPSEWHTGVARLLNVCDGMKTLHNNVAVKIEKKYGKKPYYCFQLGVHLGNLVWCSKFLADSFLEDHENTDSSLQVTDILKTYTQALQEFSEVLGRVEPVNLFVERYNSLVNGHMKRQKLTKIYDEGSRVFPITRAWIEGNVRSE